MVAQSLPTPAAAGDQAIVLDMSVIHNRSCERMTELADSSVDLIVTSPPYWVKADDTLLAPALLRDGSGETPQTYEDLLALLERCFRECFRVLKPGGIACVNVASTLVGGRLYPLPFALTLQMIAQGWTFKEELIWRRWRGWDKRGGVLIQNPYPGNYYPNCVFEYVLVFAKPGPRIQQDRTAEEKAANRIPIDDLLLYEVNNNIWNVLPVPPQQRTHAAQGTGVTRHPCPFPEELAYRLTTLYSYQGETVLDPFCGSGTTAKVARLTGRRFVGYEVSSDFARLARARLREPELDRQRWIPRFESLTADTLNTRVNRRRYP